MDISRGQEAWPVLYNPATPPPPDFQYTATNIVPSGVSLQLAGAYGCTCSRCGLFMRQGLPAFAQH